MVGVLGCMAERLKGKLLDSERLADLVVGPDAYRQLPGIINALQGSASSSSSGRSGSSGSSAAAAGALDPVAVQLSLEETYADITPLRPVGRVGAFLSVSALLLCAWGSPLSMIGLERLGAAWHGVVWMRGTHTTITITLTIILLYPTTPGGVHLVCTVFALCMNTLPTYTHPADHARLQQHVQLLHSAPHARPRAKPARSFHPTGSGAAGWRGGAGGHAAGPECEQLC